MLRSTGRNLPNASYDEKHVVDVFKVVVLLALALSHGFTTSKKHKSLVGRSDPET